MTGSAMSQSEMISGCGLPDIDFGKNLWCGYNFLLIKDLTRPSNLIDSDFNRRKRREPMQTLSFLVASFFLGVIMTIYLPMNSSVSRYVGSPITASVIFFIVALITALLIFAIAGEYDTISKIKNIPVYLYLTGVISAFMILGTTFLIPKIGARKFFILLVSGQVIMAIIVSHLGILESPKDLITLKKFFGAALVIIGVFISTI